jgi:hypothetical protein
MAVIPHAIGTIDLDYTPNASRQIEASSRRYCRPTPAVERFCSCCAIAQNEAGGGKLAAAPYNSR